VAPTGPLFTAGRATGGRSLRIDGANDSPQSVTGATDNGAIVVRPIDRERQEDAIEAMWRGGAKGTLIVANDHAQDLTKAGPLALVVTWRVAEAPAGPVSIELRCGPGCAGRADVTAPLREAAGKGWRRWTMPLACLAGADLSRVTQPLAITSSARLTLGIAEIAVDPATGVAACR
jgi:beta-glucosidase